MLNSIQIYQFIRFTSTLFVFWVLSRLFSVEEVGIAEKTLLVANLTTFFWLQAIQTHFLKKNLYSYNHYATFILIASFCTGAGIFLYSLWNSNYVFSGLYVLFYPFGTLLEMYLIAQQKNKRLIQYSIWFYSIWLISVSITAYLSMSLQMVYGVWIGVLAFRVIFCAVYVPFKYVRLNKDFFHSLTWLMLTFLVAGSAEYTDGFLVDFLFGKEVLAQFRYGAREIPVFIILASSLSLWITQNIAHTTRENIKEILALVKRKSTQYMIAGTGISILFMLVSTPAYRYVYGNAYTPSSVIFDIMLLLVASRFIFSNSILLGLGMDKIQFKVTCIELAINVILSIVLAYFWGMIGVAVATVIAYLSEKVLLAMYLYKIKGIKPSLYMSVGLVVSCYTLLLSTLAIKHGL